jgi:hypothetical protein
MNDCSSLIFHGSFSPKELHFLMKYCTVREVRTSQLNIAMS